MMSVMLMNTAKPRRVKVHNVQISINQNENWQ